jgi:hypothetical protein
MKRFVVSAIIVVIILVALAFFAGGSALTPFAYRKF